ncbi:hypothetical protein ACHAPT_005698 [Fusarium lateritium]
MSGENNENNRPGRFGPENSTQTGTRRSGRVSRGPLDAFTRGRFVFGQEALSSRRRRRRNPAFGSQPINGARTGAAVQSRPAQDARPVSRGPPDAFTSAYFALDEETLSSRRRRRRNPAFGSQPINGALTGAAVQSRPAQDARSLGQEQNQPVSPQDAMEILRQLQVIQQAQERLMEQMRLNEEHQEQQRRDRLREQHSTLQELINTIQELQGRPPTNPQPAVNTPADEASGPSVDEQLDWGFGDWYDPDEFDQMAKEFLQSHQELMIQEASGQGEQQPALADDRMVDVDVPMIDGNDSSTDVKRGEDADIKLPK